MAEVPLQTLEELDITAEEFEALVMAGLRAAVIEVLNREGIEQALRNADAAALDAILAFWVAYVSEELIPALDASMLAAGAETVSRLAESVGQPLPLLIDQPLDTDVYLRQASNRLVGIGDALWFNARASLAEGIELGESQPKLAQRIRDAVGVTEGRARTIARTESHGARNVAAYATMERFENAYGVRPGILRKAWQATNDTRTRHTHHEADGQTVMVTEPFIVGGAPLAFPGDPTGPPQEIINCVPGSAFIQAKDVSKAYRYLYSGDMVTFSTRSGLVVTVSPNHPVLTEFGWAPAEKLKQGHHVICGHISGELPGAQPDIQGNVSTAEEVFNTVADTGDLHRVAGGSVNFHGDIPAGNVDVVTANRSLSFGVDSTGAKQLDEFGLACSDAPAFDGSPEFHLSVRSPLASDGIVSFPDLVSALCFGHEGPLGRFGLGLIAQGDSSQHQTTHDSPAADIVEFRQTIDRLTGFITRDEIVKIDVDSYHGYLYSFETNTGIYLADHITSHNCRCANLVLFDPADLNLDDIPAELTLNAAAYEEVTVPLRDDTVITAAVRRTGWDSLPVAPDTHPWDGPGAAERIARDCGIDDTDVTPDDTADAWACYASAFLYRDDNADERTKGAYKLGVLDIVDGRRQLVPRGVFAVAGVLRGARGGADIPAEQQRELRSAVAGLYDHINEELDTDHVVPWDDDDDRSASLSFAADVPPGPTSDNPRYARVSGEIVVGNRATGDRREFDTDNLTWQNVGATTASLEIPLGYQYERGHGPGGADKVARVGRLDSIERRGDRLFARGVVDLRSPRGLEAARQMGTRDNPGTLAGVSIIIDEDPDGPGFAVEYQFAEGCESPEEAEFNAECMEPTRTVITDGARIRAVDLVDIPAFAEARLYLDEELPEDIEEPAEVLTASSYTITIPDLPPADWFEEPKEAPEIGAITVTEDGRFFGYLAPKKVAHRGFRDKRVTVPTGNVDYGIWMNRATLVDDGRGGYTKIATGPITMDCGHAPATSAVTGPARREHYDNACSVVATARVGENRFGVWIAGALIPGVNGEQVARMMACQLSGDWGPHREKPGKRELAAALLVPVPGFPTAHHSFTLQNGELSRTVTPVRFGVYAGVDEPVGMRAAADLMARQLGCDQETRLREFALSLRETLKG